MKDREKQFTPVGDAGQLETEMPAERGGLKKADYLLNAEVGNLRAERDGYKQAYEALNAEVGNLRAERDAYKRAYEALNAEVGDLRAERDGYKQAYEVLNAEVGNLRAERDGYKAAYEKASSELGILRMTAAPYVRPMNELLADGPSIFVVTLPKSGTVFIGHSLRQTLGYYFTNTLVTPTFPKNIIWPIMAWDFGRGGMISVSHLQPDQKNIKAMKKYGITKGVLHIRDPRAALHSWLHFRHSVVDSQAGQIRPGDVNPPTPPDLLSLPIEEQVDELTMTFFAAAVQWLTDWLGCLDNDPELDFLVMTHEELAEDSVRYFDRLLGFYGIDKPIKLAGKSKETHFRTGNNEDWRSTFKPEQVERLNKLIPDRLWSRFQWKE